MRGKRCWTRAQTYTRRVSKCVYCCLSSCCLSSSSYPTPFTPLSHPSRVSLKTASFRLTPSPFRRALPAPSPLPPRSLPARSPLAQVDNSPRAWQLSFLIYIHYNNKFIELLDTMFMILRKKNKQISFLHVYHHCLLLWSWFLVCRFGCGGDAYFGAVVNSGVHVLMYSYYLVRTLNVRRREEDIVFVQGLFGSLPGFNVVAVRCGVMLLCGKCTSSCGRAN